MSPRSDKATPAPQPAVEANAPAAADVTIEAKTDGGAPEWVPRHIAVIPDGNRRWAARRLLPAAAGHKAGVEAFKKLLRNSYDRGVRYITFYAFSTENWKRSGGEVAALMKLFMENLTNFEAIMAENRRKVRFLISGDREQLDSGMVAAIENIEKKTAGNSDLTTVICINYGGRDEIVRAAKKLALRVKNGELEPEKIDAGAFAAQLDVQLPDPDLVIRTSGEERLSNFMLWQSAYSELYFSDVLWPDFDEKELDKALAAYEKRQRRYGK